MDEQKPKIESNPESGPSERVARANVDGPDRIDRVGAADGATRSKGAEAIDIHQDTDFLWPSENEDEKEDEKRLANPSSNIVIQFDNPSWNSWLKSKLVPTVCNALGANNVAAIDIKLKKLSIHEVGVKAITSKDARTSDSKFGTLLIVLPSRFTGGKLELIHAVQTSPRPTPDASGAARPEEQTPPCIDLVETDP
ncbi:hypothetical protein EW146_g10134 [Bondarzewia mesenterica]|uniref:Uncharacterized protein n=1 Tax=Bondarzewia mesenterica TaxID=1095465 RepID=A0A4S4L051_9AGAM|nr:hypothetical protein EW146_g10134 [Bondarzewia mesenterica]